jgi:hypothetical protein
MNTERTDWLPNMPDAPPADNLPPHKAKVFDNGLTQELALLFQSKSVGICGFSSRFYVRRLRAHGLECELFDLNSNAPDRSDDEFYVPEIAKRPQFQKKYDGVICLGIGERLLGKDQDSFLDSLAKRATETIVLSWATSMQAGDGILNPRSHSYVIYQLWKRGFWINGRNTLLVRAHCLLDSLKPALMIFSRVKAPRSLAERRAVRRLVGADIERLKKSNRGNSSLPNAIVGKAVRLMLSIQNYWTDVANWLRLIGYDAMRFPRSQPRQVKIPLVGNDTNFFPVCFTCGKHFRFVRLALLSLGRCAPRIKKIYIYIDKGDPLSSAEREQLRAESQYPIAFRITKYPMSSWGGPKFLLSQLKAYREIAGQMSAGDFLVKFDSDVLFRSNEIFHFVSISKAGSVGTRVSGIHGAEVQEAYMQGGCYFIGANELSTIVAIPVASAAMAPTKWGKMPEDQFFSGLLYRCGVEPLYVDFLYFDPVFIASGTEDNQLETALQAMPSTAGIIHFEGNQWDKVDRSNMRRVADRLYGPLPPPLNPYLPETIQKNRLFSAAERVPASR